GEVEFGQGIYGLCTGVEDVDHTLVRLQLELLARLLVDVRRTEDRPALRLGGQRNGTGDLRPRLLRRPHDVRRRLVDHGVIEGLETDANSACHVVFLWKPVGLLACWPVGPVVNRPTANRPTGRLRENL